MLYQNGTFVNITTTIDDAAYVTHSCVVLATIDPQFHKITNRTSDRLTEVHEHLSCSTHAIQ